MTPEREAIVHLIYSEHGRVSLGSIFEYRVADRIIAEIIAPLRSSLATAERERNEARASLEVEGRQAASADRILIGLQEQRNAAESRVTSLQTLLAEAKEIINNLLFDDIPNPALAEIFLDKLKDLL